MPALPPLWQIMEPWIGKSSPTVKAPARSPAFRVSARRETPEVPWSREV